MKSNNAKLRKETSSSIGTLHVQLGPIVKALMLSQCDDSMRDQLEKTVELHPYDPSSASAQWPKVSITRRQAGSSGCHDQDSDREGNDGLALEIPRLDLFSQISNDCTLQMVNALISMVALHMQLLISCSLALASFPEGCNRGQDCLENAEASH
jgi:hypothetical protein